MEGLRSTDRGRSSMEVVTLIENLVYKGDLKAEHGLSFLIKTEGYKILFDVGQTGDF